METEQIKIFDQARNEMGVASREEVHKKGYWHEVFHCWFLSHNDLLLQVRSEQKKENPSLLDITAAGHLLADETVADGVREVKEELGVDVPFEELVPLGIIEYCSIQGTYIDNEIANVFLYKCHVEIKDFHLQKEEVAGIVKVYFNDFRQLWDESKDVIRVTGYEIKADGSKHSIDQLVGRDQFVPHPAGYYQTIIEKIDEQIK
ncbi:NUDIX domain-containing protein [Neobacillus drentensis]|uniref:NUDIX hydrolase n=1 Tax=Neobacillus drentensis TaxID=220684 RepID=UPI001F253EB8|nr:NUDIX domain-containing protein [Neobacillus drentensis]ULT59248.1 NUDIX domain-containing protein [Neobacillus drentensis]